MRSVASAPPTSQAAESTPPWAEITQRLVSEQLEPDRIILFGSHAWGEPDEDSDLDLLFIVPESDLSPTLRAMRAHRKLYAQR